MKTQAQNKSSQEREEDLIQTTTLPFYSVNLPTLTQGEEISAKFVYNYYTRDEGISETTSLSGLQRDTDEYDFVVENYERNAFPRYVNIQIKPPKTVTKKTTLPRETTLKIQRNPDSFIVYEDAPFNDKFCSIIVNDTAIDDKIYLQSNSQSSTSQSDIRRIGSISNISLPKRDFLNNANLQSAGIRFSEAQARQEVVDSYAKDVKAINLGISINSLLVSDMIRTVERWQSSVFTDEYAAAFSDADKKQSNSRAIDDPLRIRQEELDVEIPAYDTRLLSSANASDFRTGIISLAGFIIEKYGEQLDGTTRRYDDIYIWDPNATAYQDSNVRYGAVYKYRLRSLYSKVIYESSNLKSVKGVKSDTNRKIIAASVMLASGGTFTSLQCIESIPPNPPNNITFQQTLNGLYIRWNFPINKQKDIKRFQVFRRTSITDPFELIQEINFDQTLLPYTSGENVPEELVLRADGPIKHYLDRDFQKLNSDFIYAICCIDAHGYSSALSEQFRVRFDRLNAKLLISRVSTEGAPKPYPNVNILGDFFTDLIKSSGSRRISLYFDPEYPDVTDVNGKSLKLINVGGDGSTSYKLVLTEVNLAQSQVVDIKLSDRRIDINGIPPSQARFYTAR